MNLTISTKLENWEQIFLFDKFFLSPFVFRGQSNSIWDLNTSIERSRKKFETPYHSFISYNIIEKWMLYEFKRRAHLYHNFNLDFNDNFEWLAIMQHHGAPTRLLDFTSSIFIAFYFSVIESTTDSSIWALNKYILRNNLVDDHDLNYEKGKTLKDEINIKHIEFANKFIGNSNSIREFPSTVIPLEPKLLSERLSRQKGLFLMPTNPEKTFIDNLKSAFKLQELKFEHLDIGELIRMSKSGELDIKINIIKIIIPKNLHSDIVKHLTEVNITSETLFPGLDGLARSLIQRQIREFP